MSVFPYPKYGEVNIMFHNFIVSGSIIFMTKEYLRQYFLFDYQRNVSLILIITHTKYRLLIINLYYK
ncbi:hypothetical protein DWX09_09325 [Escherichia coli]|nr:hypothetical protein DWX09_09325 [Escherichia coli]